METVLGRSDDRASAANGLSSWPVSTPAPEKPGALKSQLGLRPGMVLAFSDVCYSVKKGKEDLNILQGVSAFFQPGRMVRTRGRRAGGQRFAGVGIASGPAHPPSPPAPPSSPAALARVEAAIMGPSGSGKTTLLDILAGRKTVGTITGNIVFGDKRPSPAFLKRRTGYVEQFDSLVDVLSVDEMLMYTAELKVGPPHSRSSSLLFHTAEL